MAQTGTCRYCGQVIKFDRDIPEAYAEEEAVMCCTCGGAHLHKQAKERREKAQDNIDIALHKHDEDVAEYLKGCVKLVDSLQIAKITVDTGEGIKVTVSKTSKGTIKVKKNTSQDEVYDE